LNIFHCDRRYKKLEVTIVFAIMGAITELATPSAMAMIS
jgi:hypothetical protein